MSSIKISGIGKNIRLLTLDMPGKSANVLTDQVYDDLDQALKTLEEKPPRGLVLYSAKPTIFMAGADLVKISEHLDWPDEEIFRFCEHGRSIMARLIGMPKTVSVAAIHGVCVGGGLELALWCDRRIASDYRRTLLGLPEVKLGLIPGWAGTVRLPRLIGLENAVDLVTSGDLVTASECLELGVVDQVVPQDQLVEAAVKLINREHRSRAFVQQRIDLTGVVTDQPDSLDPFRELALNSIRANPEIDPSAPAIALNHMLDTANVPVEQACRGESVAFARVWGSCENRGLLHNFFLEEHAKKTRPRFAGGEAPELNTVGIVGAGLMGTQIARLCARAGFRLLVFDADEAAKTRLVDELNADSRTEIKNEAAGSLEAFAKCDLVIESIVEKLKIKHDLFRRLNGIVSPQTVLATNTSTIPVRDIAQAVDAPARLVGLHFCCPVEPLRLVEIIRGEQTSDATLDIAIDLVRRLKKTPVVVGDQPGFVVNRLLCPVFDQAIVLLQHGISGQQIDRPFRDFGFAAGPLEMIDFIGVDTIMYAGETFLRTLPDLVSLTPVLPALVKRGRLGRKTGAGFYRYESADGPALADDAFQAIVQPYQKGTRELADEQILEQLLQPMIGAARSVLRDGVVPDARDVDLCSVLGTTFPRVRGGVLYWADSIQPLMKARG